MYMKFSHVSMSICIVSVFLLFVASLSNAELIAYWTLDEGAGEMITDETGNGHDGIFKGDPAWVAGIYGKALEFDGNDNVEVANGADITPESLTMATWVNFSDTSGRQDFISRNDDFAFSIGGNDQNGKLWAVITTAGDWLDVGGATAIEANRWYYVTLTFSAKTKKLTLYLDGEMDGEGDAPGGLEHRNGGALTIGTYDTRYLKGKLDEIKIWDEALSDDEIKEAMKAAPVQPAGKLGATWGEVKSLLGQ